jgi:site-specific DNA-methyltransferase (adenine-specific)
MADNQLYYGDNLDILPMHVDSESVDLIYLDPPFNSNQTYNVLFAEKSGEASAAQIKAFEDTWHWDHTAAHAYERVVLGGGQVSLAMQAFQKMLPQSDMLAYLAMMAPRLIELRRVLKPTGSIYLHCDPTASHYLKILMDSIFGPQQFVNEIIWERTNAHNMRTRGYARSNDVLLFFAKSDHFLFNTQYTAYGPEQMSRFKPDENGRLYTGQDLTFSTVNPNRQFEWRGTRPPAHRSWGASLEQLEQWHAEGRILLKRDGTPRLDGHKIYLDETQGKPLTTNWTDVDRIGNTSSERLGYPTQKPLALLERIISVSSNPGDVVLDPFCGCGTAVIAAEKLGRHWIGIDITHLAISLMKGRLDDTFDGRAQYRVIGEPVSLPDAEALAAQDKYQFQWWALGLVGARPMEEKKGADQGIDGRIFFIDDASSDVKQVILSVKGGHLKPDDIRALGQVVTREKAHIGVLLTLEAPTQPMRADAASGGMYNSPYDGMHPRLQILTIKELLEGKRIDMPPLRQVSVTFKRAPKAKAEIVARLRGLWDDTSGDGDASDEDDSMTDLEA